MTGRTVPIDMLALRFRPLLVASCCLLSAIGCGKKGPPLPPLRLLPSPVTELSARRAGPDVELRFVLPTTNMNGPGHVDLDHIEVYAVTVAPGTATPPNRELLSKTYAVGTIDVKPPSTDDAAPPAGTAPDTRPAAGDAVTFVETLTEAKLTPAPLPKLPPPPVPAPGAAPGAARAATTPGAATPPAASGAATTAAAPGAVAVPAVPPLLEPAAPAAPAPQAPPAGAPPAGAAPAGAPTVPGATPAPAATPGQPAAAVQPGAPGAAPAPAGPPAAAAAPAPTYTVRTYIVRGISKAGRPGQPSARVSVPVVPLPSAPAGLKTSFTEKIAVLEWSAPAPTAGEPAPLFNVYRIPAPPSAAAPDAAPAPAAQPARTPATAALNPNRPVNGSPLAATRFEVPSPELGAEQCFYVRSVNVVGTVALESERSEQACVTPRDIFPPSTPQRPGVLLLDGAIELVWDAVPEADLAGYVVLRGDGPNDTLRPLTPAPIRDTSFRDGTVKSGAHYYYAIVAVDRTGNASPPSVRVEGTAR